MQELADYLQGGNSRLIQGDQTRGENLWDQAYAWYTFARDRNCIDDVEDLISSIRRLIETITGYLPDDPLEDDHLYDQIGEFEVPGMVTFEPEGVISGPSGPTSSPDSPSSRGLARVVAEGRLLSLKDDDSQALLESFQEHLATIEPD